MKTTTNYAHWTFHSHNTRFLKARQNNTHTHTHFYKPIKCCLAARIAAHAWHSILLRFSVKRFKFIAWLLSCGFCYYSYLYNRAQFPWRDFLSQDALPSFERSLLFELPDLRGIQNMFLNIQTFTGLNRLMKICVSCFEICM